MPALVYPFLFNHGMINEQSQHFGQLQKAGQPQGYPYGIPMVRIGIKYESFKTVKLAKRRITQKPVGVGPRACPGLSLINPV